MLWFRYQSKDREHVSIFLFLYYNFVNDKHYMILMTLMLLPSRGARSERVALKPRATRAKRRTRGTRRRRSLWRVGQAFKASTLLGFSFLLLNRLTEAAFSPEKCR